MGVAALALKFYVAGLFFPSPHGEEKTIEWSTPLATGEAKNFPFTRTRGGEVKFTIVQMEPNWSNWKGPRGAPGQKTYSHYLVGHTHEEHS